MTKETPDFYGVLGVERTATAAEIKRAYRRLVLTVHPDKSVEADATAQFQRLQKIYETLRNPSQRAIYDQYGEKGLDDFEGNVEQIYEFWRGRFSRVTKEEIEQFEESYRGGEEEKEDLREFFERFEGDVEKALEFVPCSREEDLERFVEVWDGWVEKGELTGGERYKKSRTVLLERASENKRKLDKQKMKKRKKGKVRMKKADGPGKGAALDDLASAILKRKGERYAAFDSWTDSLAEKYGKKPQKSIKKKGAKSDSRYSKAKKR